MQQANQAVVLRAIEAAFEPKEIRNELEESNGRVYGSVWVFGSARFDALDLVRRQKLMWEKLREELPPRQLLRVGPVVLEPVQDG